MRGRRLFIRVVLGVFVGAFAAASSTAAAVGASGPVWRVTSFATPTMVVPGSSANEIDVIVTNVGGAAAEGQSVPISIADALPEGLTATEITGYDMYASEFAVNGPGGVQLECSTSPTPQCTYSGEVQSGDELIVAIEVTAEPAGLPAGALNHASVSGGGAATATVDSPIAGGSTPASFGPDPNGLTVATSSTEAGAHPDVTTNFTLNTSTRNGTAGDLRDLHFDLPAGLVGSAAHMPTCPIAAAERFRCPSDTIVGIAAAAVNRSGLTLTLTTPVYNIKPLTGEPAAFEFTASFFPIRLDTSVRSDGEYNVEVKASVLTQFGLVMRSSVTIWGVPADHNGPGPIAFAGEAASVPPLGGPNPVDPRVALLTNPTQCSTALEAGLAVDSWENPGAWQTAQAPMGTLTGCERLPFSASFSMLPDTLKAGAPAGYTFDLNVPQNENPDAVSTPAVKDVRLTMPEGVALSPSAANGLVACSDGQFALHSGKPGACPYASQIGTVEVKTPALAETLTGRVFLGEPECLPCTPGDAQNGHMVRLFVQILSAGESPIVVKLEGRGSIDQQTGRLTTTFENNPQVPFGEFKLALAGGRRAPLSNPRTCGPAGSGVGAAGSNLDLTPWSTPFTPDVNATSSFEIDEGCFGAQFAPIFTAGTTTVQPAAFGTFTMSIGRNDSDEYLGGVQLTMPPGLLGRLSSVPPCGEPQAAEGTCDAASLIGHAQALVGPGNGPLLVEGGQVFLTTGYAGAPFGLSIVVPAKAGPYVLSGTHGRGTIVVRATINVDRHSGQVIVNSEPLPSTVDGIPLQIRAINVTIDRSGFIFNPTNCEPLAVGGVVSSTQGASAAVSTPFQIANCALLAFKPVFTASAAGRTSRAGGASLDVKIAYPKGAQANIHTVKVALPKQLPARLSTIQQACPAETFNANPASCPAGSDVGTAVASTPILSVPVSGPAYLVSHGGAAFPDLVVILQGEGIRVDLIGNVNIAKNGVTSSTFRNVPDVPISSFELRLPQGPHSALGPALPEKAKGSFCHTKLNMPTTIGAQNGAQIVTTIKIKVTGCPKPRARKRRR
jgi:hypothetical protein